MTETEVVVRNRVWLRLACLPLLAVGLMAWVGLVNLVLDPPGGLGATIVAGLITGVMALVLTGGALVGLLLKQTFTRREIRVRRVLRTQRIELATASQIRQVRAAVRTGRFQVPIGRLQVLGDEERQRFLFRAFVDETMTRAEQAMQLLDEWVRQRPELVAADPSARQVFVDRGVLDRAPA